MERGNTLFLAKQHNQKSSFKTKRVYCNLDYHGSSECMRVKTIADHKETIKKQKLCYNCCKFGYQASKCSSKDCQKCGAKHHTSICDKINSTNFEEDKLKSLGTFETKIVIHQTVCDVNGSKYQLTQDLEGLKEAPISSKTLIRNFYAKRIIEYPLLMKIPPRIIYLFMSYLE